MAEENNDRVAPQEDPSFMSASPEDKHAYLMATDNNYAGASPEDQKAYLDHVRLEGATANTQKPVNVPQDKKGLIDTANESYASNPQDDTLTKIGKGLGRAIMSVPNMAREAVRPVSEEEKKEGFTGDALDYLGPIQAYRMAVKPSLQAKQHVNEMEQQQIARENAGQANHPMERKIAATAGRGLAMVPLVGPMALGLGEQAAKGDVAGTAAETLGMATGGELLNEAPKEFPTVKAAAAPVVRMAGRGIETVSTPVVAGAGIGTYLGNKAGGPVGAALGAEMGAGCWIRSG